MYQETELGVPVQMNSCYSRNYYQSTNKMFAPNDYNFDRELYNIHKNKCNRYHIEKH